MKKVLIYYLCFDRTLGGGEYLPLRFVAELQKKCSVTLALDWTEGFEEASKKLGIPIDMTKVKLVKVLPKGFHSALNRPYLSYYRFRCLRKLARDTDVCISLAQIMDFGKPAHHFLMSIDLGDKGFDDYVNGIAPSGKSIIRRCASFVSDYMLRPLLGMRTKRQIMLDDRERIYPNSNYVAELIHSYYGKFNGEVFFPPTLFEIDRQKSKIAREPLRVVYIGRVVPSKRIEDIIEIVGKARCISGKDLQLHIAGPLKDPSFHAKLSQQEKENGWLHLVGEKYGDEKQDFLLSASFAIHAMRIEAFGISITEYLKAGLVTLVPNEGGTCEVVDNPSLTYKSNDEASEILARLVSDSAFFEEQRRLCEERAACFSRAAYEERQKILLEKIVSG